MQFKREREKMKAEKHVERVRCRKKEKESIGRERWNSEK